MKKLYSFLAATIFVLTLATTQTKAQAFPQADPAVITITKQGPSDPSPTGTTISGTAIMKFRVANNSSGNTANGKIPANSLIYTVQFNPYYTYQSLVSTTQFEVISASPGSPNYSVFLKNKVDMNPGDVFDFYLNVIATQQTTTPGGETVTLNVDRNPDPSIQSGNTNTANDNVSKSFGVVALASLPLHSIDLVATLNSQNNIDLKWTTRDELNVDKFELQRSTDGSNFGSVTTKQAAGNTTGETSYGYPDDVHTLSAPVIFYRVKVTDKDGFTYYSKVVAVPLKKKASITTWPNPFVDKINIAITSSAKGQATVRLYNTSGQIMKQVEVSVSAGNNFIAVDGLDRLPKQTYLVEVTMNNEKIFAGKLVK